MRVSYTTLGTHTNSSEDGLDLIIDKEVLINLTISLTQMPDHLLHCIGVIQEFLCLKAVRALVDVFKHDCFEWLSLFEIGLFFAKERNVLDEDVVCRIEAR